MIGALQRFLRPSTLANAFSLLAYVLAGIGFIPIVTLSSNPKEIIFWILGFRSIEGTVWGSLISPFSWIADSILNIDFGFSFWKWNFLFALLFAASYMLFLLIARFNWLVFIHPGIKAKAAEEKSFLRGLFRKEFLLLKSDFNLLTNALFLPLTVIVLEVYILKDTIPISSPVGSSNAVAVAVLYFCLFGPMNSVGSE